MNNLLIRFLISIKNAIILKKEFVNIFFNKKLILLSKALYKQGLIQDFWLKKDSIKFFKIVIFLKAYQNFSNFLTLKIVSKPSRSLFFSYKDLCKLYEKQILYIFSTPLGFLSSFDCKKLKMGGLLFFFIR